MKLYFAPLEGITTYTYRNTHKAMFGDCDAYYAPFITPSENERITRKSLRDILPDNNSDMVLIPQIIANNSEVFLNFTEKIRKIGYNEININCGCPSGTVVKKNRGAGILKAPDSLDSFLGAIFEKSKVKISVKSRIGFLAAEEMDRLLEIYNKYPISQLTIHPRTRADFYNGVPDMETFEKTYRNSKNRVCYNGNVFSAGDGKTIFEKYPELEGIMLGRGAVANPAIFREIRGGERLSTAELVEFTERLCENYRALLQSDVFTLNKLKEIWLYIMWNFPNEKKTLKTMRKTNSLSEFMLAVKNLPELDYYI